ncbi:MAG: NAD(P)H-hydrate dehydratase [Acidimicrobiales bacterium]
MRPIVTPEEMKAIDAAASEPVEFLIERAGAAVAPEALRMMGGGYGRRVVVVAGKGNNGADGRAAARRLDARGVRTQVIDAADPPPQLPPADLVIDAAYGTGFRGEYKAPDPGRAPVLAVDIPSGVNGLTGEAGEGAVRANRTVTFAALKPGLLLARGAELAGEIVVADIGLDTSPATAWLVGDEDLAEWLPSQPRESHKWRTALYVVAGSAGMTGAAHLCARGAMRSGAGTVRLAIPGVPPDPRFLEVVGRTVPATGWAQAVLDDSERAKSLVVGPGLARSDQTRDAVRELVARAPVPILIDADGLFALGTAAEAAATIRQRQAATVLTPHEGEFKRLTGSAPGPDRLTAVRQLARVTGATALLKGSTTIVADSQGNSLWSNRGDARLATAGSGDVLSGTIGAFLAQGLDPLRAAALGAYVNGAAAQLGSRRGFVAGDLLGLLPHVLDQAGGGVVRQPISRPR